MLSCWIVEDSPQDLQILRPLLEARFEACRIPYEIECFSNAQDVENRPVTADLVFMDIEIGQADGLGLAVKMKQSNPMLVTVLMSNFPHYSIDGYRTGAIRFLIKPVTAQALEEALPVPLLQKMARQTWLQVDEISDRPLPFSRIVYIESQDRQSIIHTPARTYPTSLTLRQYGTMLSGADFVQCYKSILVNLAWVERMDDSGKDLIMKNGEKLPVSRHYRKQTEETLRKYIWTTF